MTDTCATCRFFHEIVAAPVSESTGECRVKPKPEPVRRTYGCGEFEVKRG